ncbi:hypothetical protein JTE90_004641 [Oedothorax gibbosus]|uniref:Uncharacterized protein n=1 Tax=Oedothorax gibbosus TaxID=931172 RepID=A0AAV6UYM3_9ARAC|nr:hypothetical protein JTE90_004641 [Oedothorax gibbosus]
MTIHPTNSRICLATLSQYLSLKIAHVLYGSVRGLIKCRKGDPEAASHASCMAPIKIILHNHIYLSRQLCNSPKFYLSRQLCNSPRLKLCRQLCKNPPKNYLITCSHLFATPSTATHQTQEYN